MSSFSQSNFPDSYFSDFRTTTSSKTELSSFFVIQKQQSDSGPPLSVFNWERSRDYRSDSIWSFRRYDPEQEAPGGTADEVNLWVQSGPTQLDENGALINHTYNYATTGHIFFNPTSGRPEMIFLSYIPYSSPGLEDRNSHIMGTPNESETESLSIYYDNNLDEATLVYRIGLYQDGPIAEDNAVWRSTSISEATNAILEIAGDSNILKVFPANWQGENLFENSPTFTPTTGKQQTAGTGGTVDLISPPSTFTKAATDKITNFNPQKDSLEISTEAFGIKGNGTFKVAGNKNALKKAAKTGFDFIYEESKGRLYFNENGNQPGWGDGGITAIISGKPDLQTNNIIFS